MHIIARFPRLPPLADEGLTTASAPAGGQPHGESVPPPDRPAAVGARPHRRASFPATSVAVLGVVAAVAWSLAAWHETVRRAAQQRPERLALQPAATFQPTATSPTPPP